MAAEATEQPMLQHQGGKRMHKQKGRKRPAENHGTAAWSHTETTSELSRASHPGLYQTIHAKEYVDENEK